jgi:hypothetical protein
VQILNNNYHSKSFEIRHGNKKSLSDFFSGTKYNTEQRYKALQSIYIVGARIEKL